MYILLGLLAAVILLLTIPLEFKFDAQWPESDGNQMQLLWAVGVVRVELLGGAPKVQNKAIRNLLKQFFGGSAEALVLRLIDDEQITPEQLNDLMDRKPKVETHERG